ncbi:MAG: hypothetical protein FWC43_12900, partial [Planctomycetaceae bacterium]|nr:hypothetical protein [Planctomycetaceae bacterium]
LCRRLLNRSSFASLEQMREKILSFVSYFNETLANEELRSIGFGRANFWIGMRNLMYNMSRLVSLKRPKRVKQG